MFMNSVSGQFSARFGDKSEAGQLNRPVRIHRMDTVPAYVDWWAHRVHRVVTSAFWRTFSHEGKIRLGWWGWGVHAHPLLLKGVWHEIFDLSFFSWISVPQAPKYSIGAVLNFFENSRRYSRTNFYHRCQQHRRKAVQRRWLQLAQLAKGKKSRP